MRNIKRDLFQGGSAIYWKSAERGEGSRNRHHRRRFKQGGGPGGGAPNVQQMDQQATQAILALAQPMQQPLAPISVAGNNAAIGQTYVVQLNNVGLNTKLVLEITGTLAPAAAETLNRTPLGMYNFLSNVTLTDLNNVQRINTTGWHLGLLATARNRAAFGAAFMNDSVAQIGSNYPTNNAPASIAGSVPFRIFYEIPISYHDYDFRGAIYAGVTSAQWRLQFTVNPNLVVGSTVTDATQAAYKSTTAGNIGVLSAVTFQVYQNYFDQLPRSKGVPVLPAISLSYNYLLINTTNLMGSVGFDTPVFYPNFRTFLSTIFQYDNGGSLNLGTDINYLAIQVANMTYLRKMDPFYCQLQTRNMLMGDFPPGHYYLDHRNKPIDTNQFGNTSFVVNPSVVNANAALNLAYEMLAIQSQAINAGSFPGG